MASVGSGLCLGEIDGTCCRTDGDGDEITKKSMEATGEIGEGLFNGLFNGVQWFDFICTCCFVIFTRQLEKES